MTLEDAFKSPTLVDADTSVLAQAINDLPTVASRLVGDDGQTVGSYNEDGKISHDEFEELYNNRIEAKIKDKINGTEGGTVTSNNVPTQEEEKLCFPQAVEKADVTANFAEPEDGSWSFALVMS